jgi:hypothetical protein
LNSGDVVDGVTLANGDRVLVANQTTKSENGIYVAGASPARATDADTAGELSGGTIAYVEQGTKYGVREMQLTTIGSITPGTTAQNWASLTPKDHGLVEALPTSSSLVGDTCTFIASKASGVFWLLVYDGEGEYPWKKIGGSSLFDEVEANESTSSTSFVALTTPGPIVTVPLKGDYLVELGALEFQGGAGVNTDIMSYSVGATAASDLDATSSLDTTAAGSSVARTKRKTFNAETKLTSMYRVTGGNGGFMQRWMRVTPIRVG